MVLDGSGCKAHEISVFSKTETDRHALSDGPNAWPLQRMKALLEVLVEIDRAVKSRPFEEDSA